LTQLGHLATFTLYCLPSHAAAHVTELRIRNSFVAHMCAHYASSPGNLRRLLIDCMHTGRDATSYDALSSLAQVTHLHLVRPLPANLRYAAHMPALRTLALTDPLCVLRATAADLSGGFAALEALEIDFARRRPLTPWRPLPSLPKLSRLVLHSCTDVSAVLRDCSSRQMLPSLRELRLGLRPFVAPLREEWPSLADLQSFLAARGPELELLVISFIENIQEHAPASSSAEQRESILQFVQQRAEQWCGLARQDCRLRVGSAL
jgi:hypothetical protein